MVCVFCSVVSPESSCDSYLSNETLHDGEDGGRTLVVGAVWTLEARGAVHEHNDVPRSLEKCQERAAVSMCTSFVDLLARVVVWWAVDARFPLAIEYAEHETSSPVNRKPCCLAVACNALAWAWVRKIWKWLTFITLPGFRAAAVKEKSKKRGFLPYFLSNSIPPTTKLRGVEGKGSSESSYAASVPKHSTHSKTVNYLERVMQGGTQLLRGVEI